MYTAISVKIWCYTIAELVVPHGTVKCSCTPWYTLAELVVVIGIQYQSTHITNTNCSILRIDTKLMLELVCEAYK